MPGFPPREKKNLQSQTRGTLQRSDYQIHTGGIRCWPWPARAIAKATTIENAIGADVIRAPDASRKIFVAPPRASTINLERWRCKHAASHLQNAAQSGAASTVPQTAERFGLPIWGPRPAEQRIRQYLLY